MIRGIYDRHSPTLVTMARGVHELRLKMLNENDDNFEFGDVMQIHSFLDKVRWPPQLLRTAGTTAAYASLQFYMSRIGIRILLGQYLELHREPQLPGYVGLINMQTSPAEIFSQVSSHQSCEEDGNKCATHLRRGMLALTGGRRRTLSLRANARRRARRSSAWTDRFDIRVHPIASVLHHVRVAQEFIASCCRTLWCRFDDAPR